MKSRIIHTKSLKIIACLLSVVLTGMFVLVFLLLATAPTRPVLAQAAPLDAAGLSTPIPAGWRVSNISLEITSPVTITLTETITPTATLTVTLTPEPSETPSPMPELPAYLPFILREAPTPLPDPVLVDLLLCDKNSRAIPDNNRDGASGLITIPDPRLVVDLDVYLRIDHTWIGDLQVTLTHQESGRSLTLLDRPRNPTKASFCEYDHIIAILDDEASQAVEGKCSDKNLAISGSFRPEESLQAFTGVPLEGTWVLTAADRSAYDTGALREWCLDITAAERLPAPTPTPEPVILPAAAQITNIRGWNQSMPLSCESRSAVDLAGYHGVWINEYTFFNGLPVSDNPDVGFVGSVYGAWGQTPPNPYGVHAAPVAALLRNYGLDAQARKTMAWDELRAEIAAGRPVEVWVIGASYGAGNGRPLYYRAQDSSHTVVSPYEHTVLAIGYTQNSVTLLDGASVYTRSLTQFLDSWSVLRNMAVTVRP
jgi:subtilisin-like proprotein convertase family protein/uncharacterized protein YvpB